MAGATSTWTGVAGGDFAAAGNWDGEIVPSALDTALFAGSAGTVTGDGTVLHIAIGDAASPYPGTWTFLGGSLAAGGEAIAGGLPDAVGFFGDTLLDGEILNAAGGTTAIAGPAGVTVTARAGAQVTSGGDIVGGSGGQVGSLVLTGSGTDWIEQSGPVVDGNLSGFLILGSLAGSSGTLAVDDGAQLLTGGGAVLGAAAGSCGSAAVAAGSWTASGGLQVGVGGAGSLRVDAGTLTSGAATMLGVAAGSGGTLVIAGSGPGDPGLLTNAGDLVVGAAGTGTLAAGENGVVTAGG
ncbi:MAG TPA: hypothetical protein VFN42_13220, partial [Acetobacteraceae bacterium]|nr:hypothetical protein [Acetobacteraceae bacterium]